MTDCPQCAELGRRIAAASDRQQGSVRADEEELDLVLEMAAHLTDCPNARQQA
jgi:hypothetical protein